MSDDPLAGFRRTGDKPKPSAPSPSDGDDHSRVYEAFNPKDNQRRGRLNIRRKGAMSQAPGYNFIYDICYDQDNYTGFVLFLTPGIRVNVHGRNLKPVIDALMLGTCEYIQEFRDDKFDAPDDPEAPFIQSIEIQAGWEDKSPEEPQPQAKRTQT